MVRRTAAVLIAASCMLAACGSDSGRADGASSAKGKPYVDALVKVYDNTLAAGNDTLGEALSRDQVRCLATHMVDSVGADAFAKAGLDPQKLAAGEGSNGKFAKDDATKLADVMFDGKCVDFADLAMKAADSSSMESLPKEKVRCLFETLAKSPAFRSATVAGMTRQRDAAQQMKIGRAHV